MTNKFLQDEEGRTPTEYSVLVFFTCCAAMMVSFVSGEIVTDLALEINKISEVVNQVEGGVHNLAPDAVAGSRRVAFD